MKSGRFFQRPAKLISSRFGRREIVNFEWYDQKGDTNALPAAFNKEIALVNFMIRLGTALATFFALQSVAHAATIRFSDDVTPESMSSLIAKVASAYKGGDRNITVQLDSPGGNLGAALNAYAQLKSYGVNTLVKNECASSCTVLFAAGKTRTASNGADFMFHAVHVEHIDKKLRYDKKKNPNGTTPEKVALDYSNRWLAVVRDASPSLAALLQKNRTLIAGEDTDYSGRDLRKYGYVND